MDSLRTIAALTVIFAHVVVPNTAKGFAFFRHTDLAVDFFFVLSGFVIALNYWDISDARSVWRYLRARFARIYPLHLLTLLLFLGIELVKWVGESNLSARPATAAFSQNSIIAFVLNLVLLNAFGLTHSVTFNVPSWSIGAESWCYLVFAAILLITASSARRGLLILSCSIVAGTLFCCLSELRSTTFGVVRGVLGFGIGCLWWVYLKGILVSAGEGRRKRCPGRGLSCVNALCIGLITIGVGCLVCGAYYPGIHVVALGLIGFCAMNPANPLVRILEGAGRGWFGQVSYGVYLWHYFVIWMSSRVLQLIFTYPSSVADGSLSIKCSEAVGNLTVILTLGVTLAIAHLSYKYFEYPWRKRLRMSPPATA